MQIKIYEEFPNKKNLSKLELIDFPFELIIAAPNLERFRELEKKVKIKNKNIKAVGYWPTLKLEEGYWISPWSKRKGLDRITEEIKKSVEKGESLYLKWDAEAPFFLRAKLYLTEFLNFWSNRNKIKQFISYCSKKNVRLITAERPNIFPEKISEFFGFAFDPKKYGNEKVKMIYTSQGRYLGAIGAFIFNKWYERVARKWAKRYGNKFVIGIGCTDTGILDRGILGKEPLISKEEFERDLRIAKENGVKKAVIFRLGGLDKDYIKIIKNYLL